MNQEKDAAAGPIPSCEEEEPLEPLLAVFGRPSEQGGGVELPAAGLAPLDGIPRDELSASLREEDE